MNRAYHAFAGCQLGKATAILMKKNLNPAQFSRLLWIFSTKQISSELLQHHQQYRLSIFNNSGILFVLTEVDIIKKAENQAKMTKLSMEWKRLCKIKAKVRVNTEESAVKPEPELKNTIECNLNPSDGPGKPNSITMKTVKTKWALNQFQQPICVQLTKTVKTKWALNQFQQPICVQLTKTVKTLKAQS
ncbi:hypothetical protein Tco_1076779 [Tanacetum coccineum]